MGVPMRATSNRGKFLPQETGIFRDKSLIPGIEFNSSTLPLEMDIHMRQF
jgi:hypothetical protein